MERYCSPPTRSSTNPRAHTPLPKKLASFQSLQPLRLPSPRKPEPITFLASLQPGTSPVPNRNLAQYRTYMLVCFIDLPSFLISGLAQILDRQAVCAIYKALGRTSFPTTIFGYHLVSYVVHVFLLYLLVDSCSVSTRRLFSSFLIAARQSALPKVYTRSDILSFSITRYNVVHISFEYCHPTSKLDTSRCGRTRFFYWTLSHKSQHTFCRLFHELQMYLYHGLFVYVKVQPQQTQQSLIHDTS